MKKVHFYYDNYINEMPKKLALIVANCRGKKAVLRDIKSARDNIRSLLVEINPCDAKDELNKVDSILSKILHEND